MSSIPHWKSLFQRFRFQVEQCGWVEGNNHPALNKRQYDVNDIAINKWWNIIGTRYSEPQRHYHTLNHLDELFKYYDQHKSKLSDPCAVALTIWFHDIIYDPKRKDNEDKSMELYQEFAIENHQNIALGEKVSTYIMATQNHTTVDTKGDKDLELFLDMDMAVLGKEEKEYDEYATNIRKEYIHIPEDAYRKGRSSVLEKFLEATHLYRTQEFQSSKEARARQNLKREIQRLKNGL